MNHQIHILVRGKASGREIFNSKVEIDFDAGKQSLMDWLNALKIPIASSCNGEGQCKKCKIWLFENEVISCQVPMEKLIEIERIFNKIPITITVDYL